MWHVYEYTTHGTALAEGNMKMTMCDFLTWQDFDFICRQDNPGKHDTGPHFQSYHQEITSCVSLYKLWEVQNLAVSHDSHGFTFYNYKIDETKQIIKRLKKSFLLSSLVPIHHHSLPIEWQCLCVKGMKCEVIIMKDKPWI